jgi:hypothetical protein
MMALCAGRYRSTSLAPMYTGTQPEASAWKNFSLTYPISSVFSKAKQKRYMQGSHVVLGREEKDDARAQQIEFRARIVTVIEWQVHVVVACAVGVHTHILGQLSHVAA